MKREHLNPKTLPDWSNTFSQIVSVRSGPARTITIAGQVAVDSGNNVVAPGDLRGRGARE